MTSQKGRNTISAKGGGDHNVLESISALEIFRDTNKGL